MFERGQRVRVTAPIPCVDNVSVGATGEVALVYPESDPEDRSQPLYSLSLDDGQHVLGVSGRELSRA